MAAPSHLMEIISMWTFKRMHFNCEHIKTPRRNALCAATAVTTNCINTRQNEAIQMKRLIDIDHRALINVNAASPHSLCHYSAAFKRHSCRHSFDVWCHLHWSSQWSVAKWPPGVYYRGEGNICTNEEVRIGKVCLELRYRFLWCVQKDGGKCVKI